MRNTLIILTLTLFVLFGTVFTSYGEDVIIGCKNVKSGLLRIVSVESDCNTKFESVLTWNQQGPQGPEGQPGPSCNENMPDFWICSECNLKGIGLSFRSLRGAFLVMSNLTNASFVESDLTGVNFNGSTICSANFRDAKLQFANFAGAIGHANFAGADLSNAAFMDTDLANQVCEPGVSIFTGADLSNVFFVNTNLMNAENLNTANLTNVNWINTICPDGTNSDANGGTCEGHLVP